MWRAVGSLVFAFLWACTSGARVQEQPEDAKVPGKSPPSKKAAAQPPKAAAGAKGHSGLEQYGIQEVRTQLGLNTKMLKPETLEGEALGALLARLEAAAVDEKTGGKQSPSDNEDPVTFEALLKNGKVTGPLVAVVDPQEVTNDGAKQTRVYVDLYAQEAFLRQFKDGHGHVGRRYNPFFKNPHTVKIYHLFTEASPPGAEVSIVAGDAAVAWKAAQKCHPQRFSAALSTIGDNELRTQAGAQAPEAGQQQTFLHEAAKVCCITIARELMSPESSRTHFMGSVTDSNGFTALQLTVSALNIVTLMQTMQVPCTDILDVLISAMDTEALLHKARPVGQGLGEGTVLHVAASNTWIAPRWVRLLAALNAKGVLAQLVPMQNAAGQTALHLLSSRSTASGPALKLMSFMTLDQILIQDNRGQTALHRAVKLQALQHVTNLLQAIPKDRRDTRDQDGHTAFDLAQASGDAELVQVFEMF